MSITLVLKPLQHGDVTAPSAREQRRQKQLREQGREPDVALDVNQLRCMSTREILVALGRAPGG